MNKGVKRTVETIKKTTKMKCPYCKKQFTHAYWLQSEWLESCPKNTKAMEGFVQLKCHNCENNMGKLSFDVKKPINMTSGTTRNICVEKSKIITN